MEAEEAAVVAEQQLVGGLQGDLRLALALALQTWTLLTPPLACSDPPSLRLEISASESERAQFLA